MCFLDGDRKADSRDIGQWLPRNCSQLGSLKFTGATISKCLCISKHEHLSQPVPHCATLVMQIYLPCLWTQTAPDVCYQAFPGSELFSLQIPTEQEMWLFFLCCTVTAQVLHTNRNSCQEILFCIFISIFFLSHISFQVSGLARILGR